MLDSKLNIDALTVEVFLSQIIAAQKELQNDYMAHRVLWRAFGLTKESAGQVQPFRFRKESIPQAEGISRYLVQSAQKPLWEDVDGIQAECKKLQLNIHQGQQMEFRLLANVQRHNTATDRKVAVSNPALLMAWLTRQAEKSGFEVLDATIEKPACEVHTAYGKGSTGRAHHDRPLHVFRLNQVRFDGVLRVLNPILLQKAILQGVGPKAAFGCGLLSVLP